MKMKHIYYWLLLLSTGLFSCQKNFLDTTPNDRLSENVFWKTQADALVAVNSLYRDLDSVNIFSKDAFTDIGHVNQPFDVNAYIELGTYDATSSVVLREWNGAFTGIAAANYFLANVDKIPVITDKAALLRYKAEARFLRAYQYLKLITLYGTAPLVTAPLTIEAARALKRDSAGKIYDFIDAELSDAANALPQSYGAADVGRITKGAALALKARADLYAGRYADAATAAKAVMDLKQYKLYPNYKKLFSYAAENNSEVILDKQYITSAYSNNVFYLLAPYSQKNSQSNFIPTRAGVDLYQTLQGKDITDPVSGYNPNDPYTNRDPRLRFSIFVDGDTLASGAIFHPAPNSGTPDAVGNTYIASTTGFNIKKYVNPEDYATPSNCGINIILMRYAEVLLTYAEAKIEANTIDQSVYDAINLVRNSRADVSMPSITGALAQSELRAIVRRERIVELAFEGLHLADVRRWKTAATVVPGAIYGITYRDGSVYKTVQVAASRLFTDPKHYLWPVPQTELYQAPGLGQNSGW